MPRFFRALAFVLVLTRSNAQYGDDDVKIDSLTGHPLPHVDPRDPRTACER